MDPKYINQLSGNYEFPRLFRKDDTGKVRIWQGFVRLINSSTCQYLTGTDWNMMLETQIYMDEKILYSQELSDNVISQIWTETGILNGKISRTTPTYPKPKNIGKKNYRNCLHQGISLIESKYKKKLEEGFRTEFEDNCPINLEYKFFPMLAKNWKEHSDDVRYPVYIQPKLDGIRAIVCNIGKEILMWSRTKKDFPSNSCNDLIKNSLKKIYSNLSTKNKLLNIYFDGELYNHNTKLQKINHLVRQSDTSTSEKLQYHIYDCFVVDDKLNLVKLKYEDRLQILHDIEQTDVIQVVPTKLIHSQKELDILYSNFVEQGFEGGMIRSTFGLYSGNQKNTTLRSKDLLKRKEVFTDEFKIVDFTTGTNSKEKNAIIWICATNSGQNFKVMPNLSYDERYKMFKECNKNFERYKNMRLTVEYRGVSIDGIPLHGKGICFRDD